MGFHYFAAADPRSAGFPVSRAPGSSAPQSSNPPGPRSSPQAPQASPQAPRVSSAQSSPASSSPSSPAGGAFGGDLTDWPDFPGGAVPGSIETPGPHGMTVRAYPAIVADGGRVRLDVLADPGQQAHENARGIAALLARSIALPEARITTRWAGDQALALAGGPYSDTSALVADLQLASARALADRWAAAHDTTLGEIRSRREWEDLRSWAKPRQEDEVYRLSMTVAEICSRRADVVEALSSASAALIGTVTDVRDQLSALVPPGFVSATPAARLPHLVRYLRAALLRIEKAPANPAADDSRAWQVAEVGERLESAREEASTRPWDSRTAATLEEARWMVEELRVSLFAQQLGTDGKVSVKRIDKLLSTIP